MKNMVSVLTLSLLLVTSLMTPQAMADPLAFDDIVRTNDEMTEQPRTIDWQQNHNMLRTTMIYLNNQILADENSTKKKVLTLHQQLAKISSRLHWTRRKKLDEFDTLFCEKLYNFLTEICAEKTPENYYSQILTQDRHQSTLNRLATFEVKVVDLVSAELAKIKR